MQLEKFIPKYTQQMEQRKNLGIPPLPLGEEDVMTIARALIKGDFDEAALVLPGTSSTSESLLWLLSHRVSPGVYPSSKAKASFLGSIVGGDNKSKYIGRDRALKSLGTMIGGACIPPMIQVLSAADDPLAPVAESLLEKMILLNAEEFQSVIAMAEGQNPHARQLLKAWAEAVWYTAGEPVPDTVRGVVIRTTGEINTDFLSPAKEAPTRDDIPLHALKIFSTSPHDKEFLKRREALSQKGLPLIWAGDVVGTGSSRKSASNSVVWWIGRDIPHVPNKRRGGLILASKIAPIFFNTIRGCGAVPVRTATGQLQEGDVVTLDFARGKVVSEEGKVLTELEVTPRSILEEARAGGRNNLIIGRKLTSRAQIACKELGISHEKAPIDIDIPIPKRPGRHFTLAQKLVGNACGVAGVLPGDYTEPQAHLVFSQDTTGMMTQQELQELACTRFATTVIQSFCHTAAGPSSKDSCMQNFLGRFIFDLGGIDLKPGDGVIHTNGNRFLLPYFIGTGGDSHTRFPIGISFPAGSDLIAFAASQGFFPLDMPESVLVRFSGKMQPGITVRDLVNAIPYFAIKAGKLNLEKGDAKVNVFADRILEIQGLDWLTVEEAYKLTDASAERSAAAATMVLGREQLTRYVQNNLEFLKRNFSVRHPSPRVKNVIAAAEEWLAHPKFIDPDPNAAYADVLDIDLSQLTEPILCAPNDPDKAVALSEVAGRTIEEVFVGSCMVDITDFRAVAAILKKHRADHRIKFWTVPPDRESFSQLAREGVLSELMTQGANVHVPGCSLCMGNQAQVAADVTVLSTSTRNFDNRMGTGSQVFLGSAHIGAMSAILGKLPTFAEYMEFYREAIAGKEQQLSRPLNFATDAE